MKTNATKKKSFFFLRFEALSDRIFPPLYFFLYLKKTLEILFNFTISEDRMQKY